MNKTWKQCEKLHRMSILQLLNVCHRELLSLNHLLNLTGSNTIQRILLLCCTTKQNPCRYSIFQSMDQCIKSPCTGLMQSWNFYGLLLLFQVTCSLLFSAGLQITQIHVTHFASSQWGLFNERLYTRSVYDLNCSFIILCLWLHLTCLVPFFPIHLGCTQAYSSLPPHPPFLGYVLIVPWCTTD